MLGANCAPPIWNRRPEACARNTNVNSAPASATCRMFIVGLPLATTGHHPALCRCGAILAPRGHDAMGLYTPQERHRPRACEGGSAWWWAPTTECGAGAPNPTWWPGAG